MPFLTLKRRAQFLSHCINIFTGPIYWTAIVRGLAENIKCSFIFHLKWQQQRATSILESIVVPIYRIVTLPVEEVSGLVKIFKETISGVQD